MRNELQDTVNGHHTLAHAPMEAQAVLEGRERRFRVTFLSNIYEGTRYHWRPELGR